MNITHIKFMKVRNMIYNINKHRYWNTKDCPTEQKEGQRSATYLYKSAKIPCDAYS